MSAAFPLSRRAYRARRQARHLAHLMRVNFPHYYPVMVTLTFATPFIPSSSADLEIISRFLNRLRNFYARKRWTFAYCRFMGVQENRASLDIHILLWLPKGRKFSTEFLSKCWPYGHVHVGKVYTLKPLLNYLVYQNVEVVVSNSSLPCRCRAYSLGMPRSLRPRFRYAVIPLYAVRQLNRLGFAYRIGIAKWSYHPDYLFVQLTNGYIVPIQRPPPSPFLPFSR